MVVDTKSLVTKNVLKDKSFLQPLCFDADQRFWLQRDGSTVEAYDSKLSKPLSRHKLKGKIMGWHMDDYGVVCVVAWSEKERILRIYKLTRY